MVNAARFMKASLADCFDRARRSPADALFLLLWLMCTVALAIGGDWLDALQGLVVGSVLLVLVAWTRRFTAPPAVPVRPSNSRAGAFVVVLVVTFTGLDALVAHPSGLLKAWDTLHWGITERLNPFVPMLDDQTLDNSVRYVLIPTVVLLLFGWRAGNLGCGVSREGTMRAVVLWSALPLVLYAVAALVMGHGKPMQLAHRLFIDVFRNGYAEEILYRGMLLGVVTRMFGLGPGNVAQALLFGLWHLGADLRDTHGVVWMALADGFATQAIAGYAYGKLTLRTGNVLAAGASHAAYDGGVIFM